MKRKPTRHRREDIIEATLALLAEFPPGEVSTRDVADRVGISQPAIFKHFESRDALFSAVVESVTEELMSQTMHALREESGVAAIRLLCEQLLRFAASRPGLPRLLVFDVSQMVEVTFHRQLRTLVSSQRSTIQLLLEQEVMAQTLPTLNTKDAAFSLVALLQGTLLSWLHDGRRGHPLELALGGIEQWFSAVHAGVPALRRTDAPATSPQGEGIALHQLDLRPALAKGEHPLSLIIEALAATHAQGLLELLAPFEPRPLLSLLASRGAQVQVARVDERVAPALAPKSDASEESKRHLFRLWIQKGAETEFLDLHEAGDAEVVKQLCQRALCLAPGGALLAVTWSSAQRALELSLREKGLLFRTRRGVGGDTLWFVTRAEVPKG